MSMQGLFGSLLVAMTVACTSVSAGEFVQIESGTRADPLRLVAYMARPPGSGPFSAVVLLHGCGGFHSSMISWADRLSRFGYAALAIDSFGSRGFDEHCVGFFPDQVADGYAALRYLTTRPFVRASHVAVVGFSQGGGSVLASLEKGSVEQRYPEKFRAGIAFYPDCAGSSGFMTAPVLLLIGQADDWTPASACEAMVAGKGDIGISRQPGDRSAVQLVVYPGAYHAFDVVDLSLFPSQAVTFLGHRLEYNEAVTKDAIEHVRRFLEHTLAAP